MNGPASPGQEEPGQGPGESIHQEATASGHGEINQAGGDLTVHKTVNTMNIHLPPPAPPAGQIVEGDIPQRPPAFQSRPGLLDALKAQVRQEGAAVIDAVTGTPGVGKSLLAASYAWACQQAGWPLIVWINAQHPDQILTGLAGLARRLNLHDPDDDARTAALKARDWLAAADRRGLLVFDNATAVEDVRPWCPATGEVQILITTRNRAFHTLFTAIDVGVFPPEQSVALLHQRTGDTTPGADEVATELGHLPLAVGQASAYIYRRRLTYPAYLALLRDYPLDKHLPHAAGGYPAGTAQAILLSIDQAEQTIPGARNILELLAVLSEAGVPRTILYGTTDHDPVAIEDIDRVLTDLADTSLISFSEDGTTVLMHRLTSRVLLERAHQTTPVGDSGSSGGRLSQVLDSAINLLYQFNTHIPGDAAIWAARPLVEMLVEQTTALHTRAAAFGVPRERLLALRAWCGQHLRDLADPARAISLLEQNLADYEREVGGDHPHALTSRNNLGCAYHALGDLGRAIPILESTLADRERVLNGDHPDILQSRNNLASAYETAGDLGRALALHEQSLADHVRVLGGDHPDTLRSRNNLAYAYHEAGDLGRALTLHEQNLADRERVLGRDHPDTLQSRNNLVLVHYTAGELGRAIPLFEQNLADRERVLGGDHPDTLLSRNNLASAYQSAGDVARAIPLLRQILTDRQRTLGGEHPDTLTSSNNLAGAYQDAGVLGRAIPLFEQTLADRERVLGGDHPNTLTSRNNLATAYHSAGDAGRAIPLFEQNLADRERVLGRDHPDTLQSRNNLASAYQSVRALDRAIPLNERTLAAFERVLGGDHPHTLQSRNNLAHSYQAAGDLGRAVPLYEQTLANCERVLGTDHPTTKIVRSNLLAARQQVDTDSV
ncbi:tetratricopeptide repeat protein [Herbidospora solisilvae]|nr:tetratricopeptide repeat protein [Herbidospora solisilvae]